MLHAKRPAQGTTITMAIKNTRSLSGGMTLEEFKEWLKKFDTDGDGRISRDELRSILRSRGVRFSGWKSGRGIKEADADGDGFIDDGEINQLVDFAQKNLGIKVYTY